MQIKMKHGSKRILREVEINGVYEFKNFYNQMMFLKL
jgi:hypothetical protein